MKSLSLILLIALLSTQTYQASQCGLTQFSQDLQSMNYYPTTNENMALPLNAIFYTLDGLDAEFGIPYVKMPGTFYSGVSEQQNNTNANMSEYISMDTLMNQDLTMNIAVLNGNMNNYSLSVLLGNNNSWANQTWNNLNLNGINNSTANVSCYANAYISSELHAISCFVSDESEELNNGSIVYLYNQTGQNLLYNATNNDTNMPQALISKVMTDTDQSFIFNLVPIDPFSSMSISNYIEVYSCDETNITFDKVINAEYLNKITTIAIENLNLLSIEIIGNDVYLLDTQLGLIYFSYVSGDVMDCNITSLEELNISNVLGLAVTDGGVLHQTGNQMNTFLAISNLETINIYQFFDQEFVIIDTQILPVTPTLPVQITGYLQYITVQIGTNFYVYLMQNEYNTTYIQNVVTGVSGGAIFENGQCITIQSKTATSTMLSQPLLIFSPLVITNQLVTPVIQATSLSGFQCGEVLINIQSVNASPQILNSTNNTLNPTPSNLTSINLSEYFIGSDLNFDITINVPSAVSPVLQTAFSNQSLATPSDIMWASSTLQSGSNMFTIYQFLSDEQTYQYANCQNTTINTMSELSCPSFTKVSQNFTLLSQLDSMTIQFMANSSNYCTLSYGNMLNCNNYIGSINNFIQITGFGECIYALGSVNNETEYVDVNNETEYVEVTCPSISGFNTIIINDNTLTSWNLGSNYTFTPVSILNIENEYLMIMMNNYIVVLKYYQQFQMFLYNQKLDTADAYTQMFVNEEFLAITNSSGATVYSLQALPGKIMLAYVSNNETLNGYSYGQNWIQSPSGNLYTQIIDNNNISYVLAFQLDGYQLISIQSIQSTYMILNSSNIVIFTFSSRYADYIISNTTFTDVTNDQSDSIAFSTFIIPQQQILNFFINDTEIKSIVQNSNFSIVPLSYNKQFGSFNVNTRVITLNYLENLEVNSANVQTVLASSLKINSNAVTQQVSLNNADLFSGNMLGYTVKNTNNSNDTSQYSIQNMLNSTELNFSNIFSNNASSSNFIADEAQFNDNVFLLIDQNRGPNSENGSYVYSVLNISATQFTTSSNVSAIFTFTLEANQTDDDDTLFISCQNIFVQNNTNIYVICYWDNADSVQTKIYQFTLNTTNGTAIWQQFEAILSINSIYESPQILNLPFNTSIILLSVLENNANANTTSIDLFDISNLYNNNETEPLIIQPVQNLSSSVILGSSAGSIASYSAKFANGNLSIIAAAQTQYISISEYSVSVGTNLTFKNLSTIQTNIYDNSLTMPYVLNVNTPIQVQWSDNNTQETMNNFLLVPYQLPIYEFTYYSNATFVYNATYTNYGNQTLLMAQVGGPNNQYLVGIFYDGLNTSFTLWNRYPNKVNEIVSGFVMNQSCTFWWVNQQNEYGILFQPTSNLTGAQWLQQYSTPMLIISNKNLSANSNFTLGFTTAYPAQGSVTNVDLSVQIIDVPSPADDDDDKFPTWAIIVICVAGGLILLGIIGYCIKKKRGDGYQQLSGLKEPMKA